ncbi:MAG TPA: bifunctional lysylphosphatidylglycerol flippase/synthetase MprF [Alphaproteobacteria bacterium]|jgi:phosphatidylglycerol lysyltransferase|nr:bifunctional lysylphosphatidylglycerol flippase/synthetase MprF [Alphaproteobacteria bacterium]
MSSSSAHEPAEIEAPPATLWEGVKQRASLIATIAIFLLALGAMQHVLRDFHYHQIIAQLKSLSARQILLALVCTAGSYWVLTFYDVSALRYVGIRLPYKLVSFASFTGYAISNNIGFALISGGSVRFRLYSAAGVSAGDIAKVVLFAGITFMAGLFGIGSFAFLIAPGELGPVAHIPPSAASTFGAVALAVVMATVVTAAVNPHPIRIWRIRIALPSARMVLAQVLISGVDISLAAAVLYIVLPPLHGIGYWGFLGLFSIALLLGVVSNVPGGIGVFESVMLLGLHRDPAAAVLGGIVAYRAIYFLIPLVVAGVLLAANELRLRRPARLTQQLRVIGLAGSRLAPPFMAALVFVAGIILLISGAAPETDWRMELLQDVVPLSILELSHILGSLIGLALLILARGLYRRLDIAWYISVLALAASVVVSLVKGLDYEEATVLAVITGVLIACRGEFYRRARVTDLRVSLPWLMAIAGVIGGIVWLVFFTTKHVEYSNELWWQFAVSEHAPRSLRATFLVVLILLVFGLSHLLRPSPVKPHLPTDTEMDAVRDILKTADRAEANVVYLRDKALLFNDARTAFIMYAVRGRSWVALGDPVGPAAEVPELIWRFRELCDRAGGRPAFYQVSGDTLPFYLDVGLTPIKVGEEARVNLTDFSLDQPGRKDLRYSVRRAERDGLTFDIVPRDRTAGLLDELKPISDAWLETRNTAEKRFSVGAFDPDYLSEFDIAVVRVNGRITAFTNIWAAPEGRQAAVDVMRFDPGASPYTMEFLFAKLMLWAKDQGFEWLGLGMAPLSGLAGRDLAPLWQRLGALVFQAGERFYNFRGLRLFKDKFKPMWEPRYLVCQGGLTPVGVFSDTAALIAGGLRGVLLK